ncbi:hypothetical protein acsn021_11030 [Anaerocolumna cellulosilytica]|uniref:Uncharacterized protein n=1 Tax=Anaerocolumna cellulosilytica TaxID=433286 RepID=A0A6S6QSE4_9FIRM|nr:hypothetical protein [Anaerocolumna cellulosilytica]MBB5194590.1 hypothetical protein [Anaerocolumna cellulosilytica]BCJ93534.1 hypothetical protein acsn021_11030 [Anaerocolumna cellulosilytica]
MKKLNKISRCMLKGKDKIRFLGILFFLFCSKTTVLADDDNKIANSKFGTGFINLANDASAFLLVASPIVGGVCALYFLIRKNAADEQDQKKWNQRLIITGICVIGAVLVTGTINVVTSYFV